MIIKNNNKVVDVQKNNHVCWEVQKNSRLSYVKKTISYGKWFTHKQPETIPSISWEGGTTVNCKCWVERTNTVREGFVISSVTEKHYLIPSFSEIASDCIVNTTGNNEDGFTFTFGIRDNATSDRTYTGVVQYTDESGSYPITVTITQTKRGKYVTKLDNASITTDLIPAGGGNISSGTLTFSKTYNTSETENASENVTFSTVSAITKGTTESPVTDVTTIPAGGTTQKQTTIDGVTLTHPSFTVKQAANTKTIKTPESKTTTSVILSVNPTVVGSSGGTVTFTLQRMYTLNKTLYQYTSGSTSGGGSDENQGPEAVNANQTYTITGITNVSSTSGTSYEVPESDTERTIKFQTTYDGITSNEATLSQTVNVLTPILLILADDAPQTKPKPEIGDVLYSTNNNKLTLDAQTNGVNNTPIAICVIPEVLENFENGDDSAGAVKTARFVSLNYMNYDTPATGSKKAQSMYFGNYLVSIGNVKGGTDETAYVGGKWNTKRCVFNATNQDKTSNNVENKYDAGYCAPACCCQRYSTLGTNPGDWYLPMPGELYQIYANKVAINEKRTALVGSGFYDYGYWSSREDSSGNEYQVFLDDGNIINSYKNDRYYVLGFLALEVSQLVN